MSSAAVGIFFGAAAVRSSETFIGLPPSFMRGPARLLVFFR
jgi:hypothetical protein